VNYLNDFLETLEAIERGPTEQDLSVAPTLNPWRAIQSESELIVRLYGRVKNHPSIYDEYLTTSPLLAIDIEQGWARTKSRWYKIGPDWEDVGSEDRIEVAKALNNAMELLNEKAVSFYKENPEAEKLL